MTQKKQNYIQRNIDKLEQPNNDHHLAFSMEREMRFFDNDELSENWSDRLSYFEEIDFKQNYLTEADYHARARAYNYLLQSTIRIRYVHTFQAEIWKMIRLCLI